jgi:hypothetical protein
MARDSRRQIEDPESIRVERVAQTAPLAGDDERQHEARGPAGSGHTQLPAVLLLVV